MRMDLTVILNGQERTFAGLEDGADLGRVVAELGLKADRVAVEHNGEIARRGAWSSILVGSGDKLEVVHFVGGGCGEVMQGFHCT
jgi:sulfur carrier protein